MTRTMWWSRAAAGAAMCTFVGIASAQSVITQWNFNNNSTSPSTGSGTLTLIGGAQEANTGGFASGSGSSDTANPNSAYNLANFPPQGTASGTAGLEFGTSTVGFQGISLAYDARSSNGASRWVAVQYSTNGGGSWTNASAPVAFTSTNFANGRTVDLTSVPALNGNANARFRIVTVFSPDPFTANSVNYNANEAYQPTGSSATQTYNPGQNDVEPFGGTIRFDMITVRGTPTTPTNPAVGLTGANPSGVCQGGQTRLTAAITPGLNPTSTGINVTVNLTSIGGSAAQQMFDDGSNGDQTAGDNVYSYMATIANATAPGAKVLPVGVSDAQGRSGSGSVNLNVADCNTPANSTVVISSVYGGGGNNGASLNADYVELFNRSGAPVDINGWSVQYASSAGSGGFTDQNGVVALSGTVGPGEYRLVQMSQPGVNGANLPTPDFFAATNFSGMGGTAGRVALVASSTLIGTACNDPAVRDFVGYGNGTICSEGAGPTANLGNDLAAFRKNNGCQDTNQNFNDFEVFNPGPRNSFSPPHLCPTTGPDCFTRGAAGGMGACGRPTHARPSNAGHFSRGGPDGVADTGQCMGDWDGDGCILPGDVASFITAWFFSAQNPGNLDGDVDCDSQALPADVAAFVGRWFAAVTNPSGEGC